MLYLCSMIFNRPGGFPVTKNIRVMKNLNNNTNTTSNNMIAMFHIGRGGQFHNGGYLTFVGFDEIYGCHDWNANTYNTLDADGMPNLSDSNGNELMDAQEYKQALTTGIGRLEFDTIYDTTYTTLVADLSDAELKAMVRRPANYGVKEALREFGYSDLEISLAEYFDDFENLVTFRPDNNYVTWTYDVIAPECDATDDGVSKCEIDGLIYFKN